MTFAMGGVPHAGPQQDSLPKRSAMNQMKKEINLYLQIIYCATHANLAFVKIIIQNCRISTLQGIGKSKFSLKISNIPS